MNQTNFVDPPRLYTDAHFLFREGHKRLLKPDEFASVIDEGYMIMLDNPSAYDDNSRWNAWHAFLAIQQIFQLRENNRTKDQPNVGPM